MHDWLMQDMGESGEEKDDEEQTFGEDEDEAKIEKHFEVKEKERRTSAHGIVKSVAPKFQTAQQAAKIAGQKCHYRGSAKVCGGYV